MRAAEPHEADAVIAFYHALITENQTSPYHPDWRIGIYPTDDAILAYIRSGAMYVLDDPAGGYLGACALASEPCEGYESVPWAVDAPWSEVAVVHLLCVACRMHGRGIGREMVAQLLALCRAAGKQAVRLDVMTKNLPAHRLYTSAGFTRIGRFRIFYEDTGAMEFDMYEFDLRR